MEAWDRGAWFEAHERWEDAWRVAEGNERRWLQGLIQLAASRVQRERGREAPAERLCEKGLAKLEDAPARLGAVDVERVRRGARE
jgi:predicted metal-dependent hydrolase